MGIKSALSKLLAAYIVKKQNKWSAHPVETQQKVFAALIKEGKKTKFGLDHGFDEINSYKDYKKQVPIRDYEQLKPYINSIIDGEANVLWPGLPIYFA